MKTLNTLHEKNEKNRDVLPADFGLKRIHLFTNKN